MEKAIGMCVQEEDKLKKQNGGSINFVHNNKKRPFHAASSPKAKDKAPMPYQHQHQRPPAGKNECHYCHKEGHYKQDCPSYLKMIMAKNGENVIPFVNESLYIKFSKSTWWIDSGATVHVANSLQGFRSTRTTLRSERHIKVANGVQADVEAVGDVSLELINGFVLVLKDVLFVPSLQRNLISVSRLDTDGLVVILRMANVNYGLIIIVLVMLSFTMIFIYCLCVIKCILYVM